MPTLQISLWDLQNLMRKTLWDFPASSLHLKVILALEQWR